jgi:ferritin-like metal-binding protein YciE
LYFKPPQNNIEIKFTILEETMSMKVNSLEDLYVHQLKDLYSAEKQLVNALPKMVRAASAPELKQGFEHHLEQTQNHVSRLEEIFTNRNGSPRGEKCLGMEGLIEEGREVINSDMNGSVRDAALIAAAQRVEHYEISGYGTARAFAKRLGDKKAVDLLDKTLEEETQTNEKLTSISENKINPQAAS